MITVAGSRFGFDGELWLGWVSSVGDVDIDEAREWKVGIPVSVCWTETMFVMVWSGYRRVHAASVEKGVK